MSREHHPKRLEAASYAKSANILAIIQSSAPVLLLAGGLKLGQISGNDVLLSAELADPRAARNVVAKIIVQMTIGMLSLTPCPPSTPAL